MAAVLALAVAGCAPMAPPTPVAPTPTPAAREPVAVRTGRATFYANRFDGRRTASGAIFRQNRSTAATNLLPLGTLATITNRENGASVEVVINDRMAEGNRRAAFDLSRSAARRLGMLERGIVPVMVEARPSRQPTPSLRDEIRRLAKGEGSS